MTRTDRTIAVLIASAILLLLPAAVAERAVASPRHCAESDPCFTWSTMGNLERGVVVIDDAPDIGRAIRHQPSTHRVVTPCEFAYLSHEGYIQWRYKGARRGQFTRHLRGDLFAQRHGCDFRLYG